MPAPAGCDLCDLTHTPGPPDVLGGRIHETAAWSVGTIPALPAPDAVVIQSRRHVCGLWNMDSFESATLGPLLSLVSRALRELSAAERVYAFTMGEAFEHLHIALVPRVGDTLDGARGVELIRQKLTAVDDTAYATRRSELTLAMSGRLALDQAAAAAVPS